MRTLPSAEEYNEVLDRACELGLVSAPKREPDRRESTRFRVSRTKVEITLSHRVKVVDVSESGIAIHFDRPVPVGNRLNLSLGPHVWLEAEVIGCELIDSNQDIMDVAYLIRCRSLDTDTARRLLMNLLRAEIGLASA